MRIWNWILGLFRRDTSLEEPPRDQYLNERHERDAFAASAARATESGMTKGSPPSA